MASEINFLPIIKSNRHAGTVAIKLGSFGGKGRRMGEVSLFLSITEKGVSLGSTCTHQTSGMYQKLFGPGPLPKSDIHKTV